MVNKNPNKFERALRFNLQKLEALNWKLKKKELVRNCEA